MLKLINNKEAVMVTILKWSLEIRTKQTIHMSAGARILTLQMQGGTPQLWALVGISNFSTVPRTFVTYSTGETILETNTCEYIGTYQIDNGVMVFHVFEITDQDNKPTNPGIYEVTNLVKTDPIGVEITNMTRPPQLNCDCPNCGEPVNLIYYTDFFDARSFVVLKHGHELAEITEVKCPKCDCEFEVGSEKK